MSDDAALLAVNAAYYRAFGSDDFTDMSRLWADEGITCIHPGWPPLFGREAVMQSYREIMRHPGRSRIEHRNEQTVAAGGDGRVLCIEFVDGAALATTNGFRRIDGVWRMVHHQASPIAGLVETANPPPSSQRFN
jgi:ketosteroid isomerase-like protein